MSVRPLIAALMLSLAVAMPAAALERLGARLARGPKYYPPTQNRFAHVPPGHERFYAQPVPAYPWLDGGRGVPTYNWGYFGARYRPGVVEQHGYYDDYRQWSYRPGW